MLAVTVLLGPLRTEQKLRAKIADINQIAAVTKRPGDVIGLHFFSPANVMKLMENVRGADYYH